jgi:hypothetical protein
MKYSRAQVHSKARKIPDLKFEQQSLTSFSGLIVFQQLFTAIRFRDQLRRCFQHLKSGKVYGLTTVFVQLVIHILLGYREMRDAAYYAEDPLVKRVLGLNRVPDPATISRTLKDTDEASVQSLHGLLRDMIFERLKKLLLSRITLDFDGSVQSTGRFAEGTAVGFNKKKKGQRSYYPLFCTIAQTGQVLDFLHRPGNVHDSNGAKAFILACIQAVEQMAPGVQIEVRIDSAFFSDAIVTALDKRRIEFSVSVPFERLPKLKNLIEARKRWWRHNRELSYFEIDWKPDSWDQRFRFICVRTRVKKQRKEPVQLDLFIPHEHGYEFKVLVTNKTITAPAIVAFHNGRGSQEGIFAELKSQCHMGHIPVRGLMGNQIYLLAGLFAHNLTRELQMRTEPQFRRTTAKRAALWAFERLDSLRHKLICRAGRITHPQGRLTLTISGGRQVKERLLHCLETLKPTPQTG